jgi:soluble cytochrome b562
MRLVRAVLVAAGLSLAVMACSSDAKTTTSSSASSSSGSAATTPEEHIASASDVAAGLAEIKTTVAAIVAAGTDKAKMQAEVAKIEPVWMTIEGTVKANDVDTYLAFEDAFAVLEKAAEEGDVAAAKTAAATVTTTADAYLAKYPG